AIEKALDDGADEIDVVIPYKKIIEGDYKPALAFLQGCRAACPQEIILKAIIESGELRTPEAITIACNVAINAGANFIKTSTGKTPNGASLEAVRLILETIQQHPSKKIGIKVSGGISSVAKAIEYLNLIRNTMGAEWV